MEYTKPLDHLIDTSKEERSNWYIVDLENMTKEELIEFSKRFCSVDKEGRAILWLRPERATEMGLKEWK